MKKLAQGAVGTGSGTLLYTVPAGFRTEVLDITMSNTTGSALTLYVHLVPVGTAVAAANALVPNVAIPANTFVQWTGVQLLNEGDFIQGVASGSGVTINITGDEKRRGI